MKSKESIANVVSAVTSVLLALWYLLGVTGLDVHSDREHGRTYVVCSISGGDCEHIHPEAHCHDEASEPRGGCLSDEDCCSDDFEAVLAPSELQDGMRAALPVVASNTFPSSPVLRAQAHSGDLGWCEGLAPPSPP